MLAVLVVRWAQALVRRCCRAVARLAASEGPQTAP